MGLWLGQVQSRHRNLDKVVFAVILAAEVPCPGSLAMDVPLSILLTDAAVVTKDNGEHGISPKCAWLIWLGREGT